MAPQRMRVRPESCRRLAKVSMAWMPVASMAVMLRRRRMTTGSKASRLTVASTSFSVVPKRNGPWMRRSVT